MVQAMIRFRGPVYLRINRNDLPVYTPPEGDYEIGRIYPLAGSSPDPAEVGIFATGVMVRQSMEAAERLYREGISARVLNVSTLKPLFPEEILRYVSGKKAVVTAEEAVKTGGLGEAVASAVMGKVHIPFEQVAVDDRFGTSAQHYDELLAAYGLGSEDVYRAVKRALG